MPAFPSEWTEELPEPCTKSTADITARIDEILRPSGALSRLDDVAIFLAGWQRTASPSVDNPACLIFAGDHGVAAEGVSAYPAEVTGAMLAALNQEKASVSAMAAVAGASVTAIDLGVGKPTGNFRIEPAMDHDRFDESLQAGRQAVADLDPSVDLVVLGELGIGNTTAAAAVTSALLDQPASQTVGGGTGVVDDALANKVTVVEEAAARAAAEGATADSPMEVLRQLGGTELAGMAGAILEARKRSIAVLLDGYVTAAPALAASRYDHRFGEHLIAGHGSAEPGHQLALQALGLSPLINLGFRLGEGSGAMAALPLIKMACKLATDVPTFSEWFGAEA